MVRSPVSWAIVFDGKVANISRCRTITATPQVIWGVLADFGSLSLWADNVDHSCVLNRGPDGAPLGTTRRVQVGRNTLVERITEFDPPTALAYQIEGLPRRLPTVTNRWTLSPAGAATLVTLTSTVETRFTRPAVWLVLRFLAHQSDVLLAGLAHRLENPHV